MIAQPHGIMFHHFWDDRHPKGQGALSQDEFARMIEFLGRDRILPADEWRKRAVAGRLEPQDLCLTFDDALRCQMDVALPVMEDYGLTAFWFVYTSAIEGTPERLEIYRYYRTVNFETPQAFYDAFFERVQRSPLARRVATALDGFDPKSHLAHFSFYTDADRIFRYVRDDVLGVGAYNAVMDSMVEEAGLDRRSLQELLWLDPAALRRLDQTGHIAGLHSHTHPTRMGELPPDQQAWQYQTNHAALSRYLGRAPDCMSHPCNSYNKHTLAILEQLGVRLGFRANMTPVENHSQWEYPREDHANVLRAMHDEGHRLYQQSSTSHLTP